MPAKDYFYYIDTTGYCSNGNFQLSTVGKPNYAKICAWKPSFPNVVYGCDAYGGICWTSIQGCDLPSDSSIRNSSLGNGLQSCTRPSGESWCCRDDPVERCGITPTEPFICWANDLDDDNPMRDVNISLATNPASVRIILSSKRLTISSPTAVPIITTASVMFSATNNNTGTILTSSTGGSITTLNSTQQNGPGISAGAIAGVAVGSLVVLGVIVMGIVFVLRKKKQQQLSSGAEAVNAESKAYGPPSDMPTYKAPANELSDAGAMQELAHSTYAELSGPRRDQRHELSA